MSTDRELLELAAKAAGIEIPEPNAWFAYRDCKGFLWLGMDGTHIEKKFNPLNDDGDALRLAVKLKMDIRPSEETQTIHIWSDVLDQWIGEFYGGTNDSYAATRRAIVRAAAELGRSMK